MPKLLDVVIGITVVMLVVSMAVTLLTQFVTSLFNMHGKALKSGLANLISQIDSSLTKGTLADEIAGAILTHPLIGDVFLGLRRSGTVIHRDELTKLLMELAVAPVPAAQPQGAAQPKGGAQDKTPLAPQTRKALAEVLRTHGISDPAATLEKIRMTALTLEESKPELASNLRHDLAIMQEAKTQFVAKINAWFDQSIDRVSSVFTQNTQLITFGCAALVAVMLQLDTIAIVNGLWTNDELRKELVHNGIEMVKAKTASAAKRQTTPGGEPSKTPAQPSPTAYHFKAVSASAYTTLPVASGTDPGKSPEQPAGGNSNPNDDAKEAAKYLDVLSQYGVVAFPALNGGAWQDHWWSQWWAHWSPAEMPGVILSALLLSMGAPFWYGSLQTLLRLRSQIAETDDKQRNSRRQGEQVAAAEPAQEPPNGVKPLPG